MSDVPEDLLDLYFRELGEVALLAAEDEVRLAQEMEAGHAAELELAATCQEPDRDEQRCQALREAVERGQQAFQQFVAANLRLVVREAAKESRKSDLDLGELIQEGNLGLIRAVEKFDWRKGFKFSTYATWWIKQALQRGRARRERSIRLPAEVYANLMKVRAAEARLHAEQGRPPCLDELAHATRLSETKVRQALAADYHVASLDRPLSDGDDGADLAALVARATDSPADEVLERLYVEGVFEHARQTLPERSWYVLQRRYGLDGYEPSTLEDVGSELGVSRETVRKIEQRALASLQQSLVAA